MASIAISAALCEVVGSQHPPEVGRQYLLDHSGFVHMGVGYDDPAQAVFGAPRRGPSTAPPSRGAFRPSSDNSPTTAYCSNRSDVSCPLAASTPSVMGKSNDAACLGSSAGARLITTRSCGRWKPEFTIARSTRWVLSLTAASGSPTENRLGHGRLRDVHFHVHRHRFDAQQRERAQPGQHAIHLTLARVLLTSPCALRPLLPCPASPRRQNYRSPMTHICHCGICQPARFAQPRRRGLVTGQSLPRVAITVLKRSCSAHSTTKSGLAPVGPGPGWPRDRV